jgi:hypothetical protein
MINIIRVAPTGGVIAVVALALAACGGGTSTPATVTAHDKSSQPAESQTKSWTMPNEVGKDLQTAQDDIQALTGNPMFISTSKDLTGQGRHQVMDRNWQVCSSTPPAGETFTSQTNVVFGVVRIDSERCP